MKVQFVTAETSYGVAYGWRAECSKYLAFGDTKQGAIDNYKQAYFEETGKAFKGCITAIS